MGEDIQARLERLRTLLYEPATAQIWRQLLLHFAAWPADSVAVGVDYAQQHLARWPDTRRELPVPWVKVMFTRGKRRGRRKRRDKNTRTPPKQHPALALVRSLRWQSASLGQHELLAMDRCAPLAEHLRHLSLPQHKDVVSLLKGLALMKHLAGLRSLRLPGPQRYHEGKRLWSEDKLAASFARAMANPLLAGLESLDLSGFALTDALAAPLLEQMPGLEHLILASNELSPLFISRLLQNPRPALRSLVLSGNMLGGEAVGALLEAPSMLPGLELLDLSLVRLSEEALEGLAQGQRVWGSLRVLSLSHQVVSRETCALLLRALSRGAFPALRQLSLVGCGVDKNHLALLLGGELPASLELLDLRHNWLDEAQEAQLREALGHKVRLSPQRMPAYERGNTRDLFSMDFMEYERAIYLADEDPDAYEDDYGDLGLDFLGGEDDEG